MGLAKQESSVPQLTTGREPTKSVTSSKADGAQAFDDALKIVIGAWIVIFLFYISVRSHVI